MKDVRLFTWLDVESVVLKARYRGMWPDGTNYTVYSDSLEISFQDASARDAAQAALEEWFGSRYDAAHSQILLEAEPGRARALPIVFLEEDPGLRPQTLRIRPTFSRVTLFPRPDGSVSLRMPDPLPAEAPAVIAFYSYKGGVGRTTHLLALLKAVSERSARRPRLLIVDADLEAPGLTWWVRHLYGPPDVSFLDLLALAQYDRTEGRADTVRLVGQYLKQQLVWLEARAGRVAHYFLPAFRDLDQALRLPLRPEHLVQVPGQEWLVSDLLARLGWELNVEAVVVDLRAGFSEMASPLLFDPRIRRVLVTSTSSQSVDGTCAVLEEIRKLGSLSEEEQVSGEASVVNPVVIISLVPPREEEVVHGVRARLFSAYPGPDDGDLVNPPALRIEETGFAEELLHLDGLEAAWDRLGSSGVVRTMAGLGEEWLPERPEPGMRAVGGARKDNAVLRRELEQTARQLVFAESGRQDDFLRTGALEKLGTRFQIQLPLAVVMGAKGAGKTFIFLQMLRRRTWDAFLTALGLSEVPVSALFLPILEPANLEEDAKRLVRSCVDYTVGQLGGTQRLSRRDVVDSIRRLLRDGGADESAWRSMWVRLVARALGVDLGPGVPERELQEALRQRNVRVVVVLDGLEDIFQELHRDGAQQRALRALCQDLPEALRDLPDRRLGLVVFVRKDLVKAAVPQNFGQFENLHAPYELRWNAEEAIRLAAWLCRKAGLDLDLEGQPLEEAPREVLERALYPVWGHKLGTAESREAVTANWVLAALSDFAGHLQARDVVRFFRFAAERAQQMPEYEYDWRLLQPAAVRHAIEPCSREKVQEVQQEIPWLGEIFKRFERVPDRRIPFRSEEFDLKAEEVRLLLEAGIVLEEEGALYIPEIFRRALGFRLDKGARPRVLALMKRAQGVL